MRTTRNDHCELRMVVAGGARSARPVGRSFAARSARNRRSGSPMNKGALQAVRRCKATIVNCGTKQREVSPISKGGPQASSASAANRPLRIVDSLLPRPPLSLAAGEARHWVLPICACGSPPRRSTWFACPGGFPPPRPSPRRGAGNAPGRR